MAKINSAQHEDIATVEQAAREATARLGELLDGKLSQGGRSDMAKLLESNERRFWEMAACSANPLQGATSRADHADELLKEWRKRWAK